MFTMWMQEIVSKLLNSTNCLFLHIIFSFPCKNGIWIPRCFAFFFDGTQMHILTCIIVMCTKPFLIYFLSNSYSNRLCILWSQPLYSIYNCVLLNTLEIECYKCWSRVYKSKVLILILLSLKLHPIRWCLTRKVIISYESMIVKFGSYTGNLLSSLLFLLDLVFYFLLWFLPLSFVY